MPEPSRILVVDDDVAIVEIVAEVLRGEGYEVTTAANGRDALRVLGESQPLPELVVLDMRMPVLNGWEFAAALRERGLDIPLVVMTAASNARRWASEVDAVAYLPKPFDIEHLVDTVEGVVRSQDSNGKSDGTASFVLGGWASLFARRARWALA